MPIEPTSVRVDTIVHSSSKTDPSGVRTSTRKGVAISGSSALPVGPLALAPVVLAAAGGLDDVLDRALQEERRLGDVVVLALDDLLEAADRVLDLHVRAVDAGERRGDVERLRQKALDAPG